MLEKYIMQDTLRLFYCCRWGSIECQPEAILGHCSISWRVLRFEEISIDLDFDASIAVCLVFIRRSTVLRTSDRDACMLYNTFIE